MPETPQSYQPITPAGLLAQDLCRSAISAVYGDFGETPQNSNEFQQLQRLAQTAMEAVGRVGENGSGNHANLLAQLFDGSKVSVRVAELLGPQPITGETVGEVLDNSNALIRQLADRIPSSDPVKRQKLIEILLQASADIRNVFEDED